MSETKKYIMTKEIADDIKRSIDGMVGKQFVSYAFERALIDVTADDYSPAFLNYVSVRVK